MLKTIIITLALLLSTNAYSFYKVNTQTTYNLSYQGKTLELKGNFFLKHFTAREYDNVHKVQRKYIVDGFLSFFTAFKKDNSEYVKKHSEGNKANFNNIYKQYKEFFKAKTVDVLGYALFNDYAIVFLEQSDSNKKMIFIMEQNEHSDYNISLDFKAIFPNQYNLILNSFKGKGDFIINKA